MTSGTDTRSAAIERAVDALNEFLLRSDHDVVVWHTRRVVRWALCIATAQDFVLSDMTADLLTVLWDLRHDIPHEGELSMDFQAVFERWAARRAAQQEVL